VEVSYKDLNVKGYIHAERDPENPQICRVNRVTVKPEGMGIWQEAVRARPRTGSPKGRTKALPCAQIQTSDKALTVWPPLYRRRRECQKKYSLAVERLGLGAVNERMTNAYRNLKAGSNPENTPAENGRRNGGQ
jgi:hypothetical protein